MSKLAACFLVAAIVAVAGGCNGEDKAADKPPTVSKAEPRRVPQLPPPMDIKEPPKDALKTASGMSYTRLVENRAGAQFRAGHPVLIRYTGWRQRTGETFFTSGIDGQTITIDPEHATPAFREIIPLLHKGEKAMLWLPAGGGMTEPVVYEIELVDEAPASPPPGYAASR